MNAPGRRRGPGGGEGPDDVEELGDRPRPPWVSSSGRASGSGERTCRKWMSCPSMVVTNCGHSLRRASCLRQSYEVASGLRAPQVRGGHAPAHGSSSGRSAAQRVRARRSARSSRSASGISMRNGRMSWCSWVAPYGPLRTALVLDMWEPCQHVGHVRPAAPPAVAAAGAARVAGPELARLEVDVRTVRRHRPAAGARLPGALGPRRHGGLPPGTGHGAAAAAPGRRRGCGGGGRPHRRRRDGGGHRGVVAAGPGRKLERCCPPGCRGDWRPCRRPPSPSPAPVPRSTPTTCRPSPPPAATTRCCASTTAATTAAPPVAPSSPPRPHRTAVVPGRVGRRPARLAHLPGSTAAAVPSPSGGSPRPPPADDIAAYVRRAPPWPPTRCRAG